MKKFILALLWLPVSTFAQTTFKDINGKWQEESRTKKKGKEINFKDTLRIEIRKDGFMMIRHSEGATITGQAEIKGTTLLLDDVNFSIVESDNARLTLNDDDGDHHFKKIEEFSNSPVIKKMPGVEEGKKDITISTVKGKWTCYKKTDPEFNRTKFYLKVIDFREDKGNGTYAGTATFNNNDSVYTTDAFIYVKENDFVISSDHETFKATVIKSDGEEMILQSGTIHYFLKQFGKKE